MTNDPDLDQLIETLRYDARRMRDLQRQVRTLDPVKDYNTIAARKFDLAEVEEQFRVQGERLKLADDRRVAGRALVLVVEQVDDLRKRRGKRPAPREVVHTLRIATDAADRDRAEAEADIVVAQHARLTATLRAAAGAAALTYLEASR